MKAIASILLVMATLVWTSALSARSVQIDVEGLACEGCSANIAKKLRALPVVSAVAVDLESHLVMLQLRDGAEVSDVQLNEVISKAGYAVTAIQRSDAQVVEMPPTEAMGAKIIRLQRIVYVLGATLLLVLAFPWLRRAVSGRRTAGVDSAQPDAAVSG